MRFFLIPLLAVLTMLSLTAPARAEGKRILMIMTSNHQLFGTGKRTGFWFDEMATPYYMFQDAGHVVTLTSVKGGLPPVDPESEKENTPAAERFRKDEAAMSKLTDTLPYSNVLPKDYDAVMLVGGHGALWDFGANATLQDFLDAFVRSGKPVAAQAQATVALYSLTAFGGGSLWIAGKRLTSFTKEEEVLLGLDDIVPTYPDKTLKKLGAVLVPGKPFAPQAIRDGNLITSQNPASAAQAAKLLLDALK